MNGYIALYKGKQIEVYAKTSLAAQELAAVRFGVKPNKTYLISVYLCEKSDGSEVTQVITA